MLIRLRSSCSSSSSSWAGSWTSPASLHVGGAAQPASCTADWNDRPGAVTAPPSTAAHHAKTTPGAHRLYRLAPTLGGSPKRRSTPMALPEYPKPPFKRQQQSFPGKTSRMDPRPDHGEGSYEGSAQLQGKRALITGGDSGIGAAVAIAYAREGADVAIAFLPGERDDAMHVQEQIEAAGQRALLVECDISDAHQAADLVEQVRSAFGGLDILVNNAAYQRYFESFDDITLDEWRRTFETNVHAVFNLVRLSLPMLENGGCVINTAS